MESTVPIWSYGTIGVSGGSKGAAMNRSRLLHDTFSEVDGWIRLILGPFDSYWDVDDDGRKNDWRRLCRSGAIGEKAEKAIDRRTYCDCSMPLIAGSPNLTVGFC